MAPLFDMFTNAQNGEAIAEMARRFGLSQKQAEEAIAALLPAFSTGLKRNASDPTGIASFLQALAGGNHARYFEDMGKAFAPEGVEEGNGILGHLFGSREVSRAVAAQAAQATGIAQDILKQMLPVIAATLMGGFGKQSAGQMNAMPGFGAAQGNVFGEVIERMMRQQADMAKKMQPRETEAEPAPNPFDNPFGRAMEEMFGGGREAETKGREHAADPADPADNPLGRILEEMLGGGARRSDPEPEQEAGNPHGDLFGEMFETGRRTREEYQKSMESIFDSYLKGMQRR
ncbi:DUF937 domain-containing protein [Oricola thermophila]|uniref:DUF937 domain-containing protein n=1 Tax=Oricola thermophila TaxID=2742145 RepID=A0A6N1VIS8_9HYPH|nr:DUF937 domain-containing protein [Oricola thermophila]QKV19262.1 DUF937 domain-containing protein [Oricola thermophila]